MFHNQYEFMTMSLQKAKHETRGDSHCFMFHTIEDTWIPYLLLQALCCKMGKQREKPAVQTGTWSESIF